MHQPGVVTYLHSYATGNEVAVVRRDDSISGISMSVCSRGSRRLTAAASPFREVTRPKFAEKRQPGSNGQNEPRS
jgi:hypothetical protein